MIKQKLELGDQESKHKSQNAPQSLFLYIYQTFESF